jgi:hypothetical protein
MCDETTAAISYLLTFTARFDKIVFRALPWPSSFTGWISNHGDSACSVYSMSSFAVHISISAQKTALLRSGDNHRVAGFATILVDPVSEIEREKDGAPEAFPVSYSSRIGPQLIFALDIGMHLGILYV